MNFILMFLRFLSESFPREQARTAGALVLFGLTLGLTACSPAKQPSKKNAAPPAIPVTVVVAQQKDVPVQIRAIGNVHAYSTVSVRSWVDGQLAKVGFKEGDEVRKDDLLFTIEPAPFQVALRQAEAMLVRDAASLQNAEVGMKRTDELASTKAVSATVVDENRSRVASLKGTIAADEAAVEAAKVQLSHCYIHSPINGKVGVLLVNEGNVVKNNDTVLAIINQLQPIYVDFSVPEQHLASIREHFARGPLQVDAVIPNQKAKPSLGQLRLINNQVDMATGTILARAEFPNSDERLWPGQFVDVSLTLDVEKNQVVLPADAVQFSQQGRYVIVVKPDRTVEFRPVEIGENLSQQLIIRKGLAPGEQVVSSGQLRLQPGARVEIKANAEDKTMTSSKGTE